MPGIRRQLLVYLGQVIQVMRGFSQDGKWLSRQPKQAQHNVHILSISGHGIAVKE